MDIRRILIIIKRWIWLLVLGTLVAGAAGYIVSNQETPLYQASTRFVILRAATTGFDYYAFVDFQQLIQTYSQLLTTDALLDEASEQLGYSARGVSANAAQIGDTQFMRLTVTHPDPIRAAEIANVLVQVLIEQNEQLQSVRYETTERNMQQRADHALEQIELLQAQIDMLSVASVQEQLNQVEAEIEALQDQIIALETTISELETVINDFRPQFATEEQLAQHEANRAQLAEYRAQLNQLNPVLNLYQQIFTNLTVLGRAPDGSITSSIELSQLQTNLNLYQQIYVNSISSLEALNLARAQSAPNVIQVEPARVPRTPISPKPMQDAALYGSLGLLGTAGIAFLIEYLDDTLKTPDDVKMKLGLPVIGFVSELKPSELQKKEAKTGIYVATQPRSPVSESFRSLRTSLEFYSVDSPLCSIVVTSSGPQEGKTTIATNLAVILAQNNKRVLLLDADLRRPNIHTQLGISNRLGLSNLMRNRLPVGDVIQTAEKIPNLYAITSGSLPPNPAEILSSDRMTRIIEQLKKMFDMIIIDSPPTIVSDPQILSTKSDAVLFVIRPGKTRAVAIQTPLEEFSRVGANVIGVIMNRIPRNREFYYGGYGYYSTKNIGKKYYRSEEVG